MSGRMFVTTHVLAAFSVAVLLLASLARAQNGTYIDPTVLDACPGYDAKNVAMSANGLIADLVLAGPACNVFGSDLQALRLEVTYETDTRLHVKITDPSSARYEVPDSILPRPVPDSAASEFTSEIRFNYSTSPFAFTILRSVTGEVLFDTSSHPVIFEPQYLRVKTSLPSNANIYGLGEHTETLRLPTYNLTRTLWSRDSPGVPVGTNLYGNHPIYFEHRTTGTHGVFLLNSNGMDIKINSTLDGAQNKTTLEYNVIGGVFDFYFLAGSTDDPTAVARQYADIVGLPAEMPYWSFGLHQCRWGYTDFVEVADVITNYSLASIPLETMWTDIDYMYQRWVFTVDPDYFPLGRMREIVDYLHAHGQRYIMMVDPAVAYQPGNDYGSIDRGLADDIFLKEPNGSVSLAVVWPGVAVYPDWFNPKTQDFWSGEFQRFFDPNTGIDVDGAWLDMNEPSNFCIFPCGDPFSFAVQNGDPPNRTTSAPSPNATIFGLPWPLPSLTESTQPTPFDIFDRRRQVEMYLDRRHSLSGRDGGEDLFFPPYAINNAYGALSNLSANVDIVHQNGLVMYDTHNMFGTMMSNTTRNALLSRRPGLRPFTITRSTFSGAGNYTGKWLGDNESTWVLYRKSIAGMLNMASIFQVPMVGSDICGFQDNTTETLCARWATLGAFSPFMRNHNAEGTISQEFYRWPLTAQAAINALDIRYRLLDYFYTAFHIQHATGTPVVSPIWFKYGKDENTFDLDLQFFFGDALLVSPVTDENVTIVEAYIPDDTFYDFYTRQRLASRGAKTTFEADFTSIPLSIRGGSIIPMRMNGTMTTAELREMAFEILVAPDDNDTAIGMLYFDDGVSVDQDATTEVSFSYSNGTLSVCGTFNAPLSVDVERVVFLGVSSEPGTVSVDGTQVGSVRFNSSSSVLTVDLGFAFDHGFKIAFD